MANKPIIIEVDETVEEHLDEVSPVSGDMERVDSFGEQDHQSFLAQKASLEKGFVKTEPKYIKECTTPTDCGTILGNAKDISKLSKKEARKRKKMMKRAKRKRVSRTRRFVDLGVVIVVGILTGALLGNWYYKEFYQTPDYSNYSEESLADSLDDILLSVTGYSSLTSEDKANFVALAQANGITPDKLTYAQNYLLAEYALSLDTSYAMIGTGQVATIATQSIYSSKFFDGSTYGAVSISKGLLTIANYAKMDSAKTTLTEITGTNVTDTSADWTGESTSYTPAAYKALTGGTPDKAFLYVISTQTVLNNDESNITISTDADGKTLYTFTMNLDPVKSVINYVKQVKQTSGLSQYPTFSDISFTVTIDQDWNFVSTDVTENYTVVYGIPVGCTGTLTTTFTHNGTVTMPDAA